MVDSTFTASSTDAIDNDIDIDTLDNGSNSTAETIEPEVKPHLILALDYGVKKMGMALGNNITQTARAFDILAMNNGQPDWDNLIGIIKVWGVAQVVVGLPLNMDGTNQEVTFKAKKFANRLHNHYGLPVETQDERLTTADAKARLFEQGGYRSLGKGNVDNMSAVIILESFFEQAYG